MRERPNILVFMTDDHGPWAMHHAGLRALHTPSMDDIARQGARMTRAFTPCPVCSPARASFFTGRLPSQHGIHDYIDRNVVAPDFYPLANQLNIGSMLQREGYRTGMIGKWHCGSCHIPKPGFDRWYSYYERQGPHFGNIAMSDQGKRIDYHGYPTDAITDEAITFLRNDERGDDPFFLFVGYVDTHTPYTDHPARLVEHYMQADLSEIPTEAFADCHGNALVPWTTDPDMQRQYLAQYLAAVTFIDEHVGRIMDELQSSGRSENTLIVYTSDHGHNNGHHGIHCKGNATTPQNFLDESIMVPQVCMWPGGMPSGVVIDQPVDHCDLFATLLDAGQTEIPADINTPGRSFLPLLQGESVRDWRDAQFCEYGNARMIRTEQYKFIRRYPGPNGHFPDELYDLKTDPRETVNCITDHPAVASDMAKRIDAHFARHEVDVVNSITVGEREPVNPNEPWRRDPTLQY